MEEINYRGFIIDQHDMSDNSGYDYIFVIEGYDGAPDSNDSVYFGNTIEECKQKIDEFHTYDKD